MIKLRNPDIRSIFGAFTLFTQNSEHFPKIGLACSSGTKNFFPVQQEAGPTYTCLGILSVGNLPRPAPDSCASPFSDMARTRVNISLGVSLFHIYNSQPNLCFPICVCQTPPQLWRSITPLTSRKLAPSVLCPPALLSNLYESMYLYTNLKYCLFQVLPLYPTCTLVCVSALAPVPTGTF